MTEKALQKQDDSELNPFINTDEKKKKDYNGKDAEKNNCKTSDERQQKKKNKCSEKNANLIKNGAIIGVLVLILLVIILSAVIYFIYRDNDQFIGEVRLEVRPASGTSVNIPLIWYESYKRWQHLSDNLIEFLKPYRKLADNYHYVYGSDNNCTEIFLDTDRYTTIEHYYYCLLKSDVIDRNCTEADNYGYSSGQPCVAIQLNHNANWLPIAYNQTDLMSNITMPHIVRDGYARNESQRVYMSCNGSKGADKENAGPVHYFPAQAISFQYWHTFANHSNYLPPFVFAKFSRPIRGIVISITCRIWIQNSDASVSFDLLDDSI